MRRLTCRQSEGLLTFLRPRKRERVGEEVMSATAPLCGRVDDTFCWESRFETPGELVVPTAGRGKKALWRSKVEPPCRDCVPDETRDFRSTYHRPTSKGILLKKGASSASSLFLSLAPRSASTAIGRQMASK